MKAIPLVIIAVGLRSATCRNTWNIGAEGQLTLGAITGSLIPILLPGLPEHPDPAADAAPRHPRRRALRGDPGVPQDPLRHQRDPDQPDAGLCRRPICSTGWCAGRWRDPQGFNFPGSRAFTDFQVMPILIPGSRVHLGLILALVVVAGGWFLLRRTITGFSITTLGQAPRAGRLRRLQPLADGDAGLPDLGRARRPRRHLRGRRAGRQARRRHLARLRLHRDHRRLPRPAQSGRRSSSPAWSSRSPSSAASAPRSCSACRARPARVFQGLLLFFVLACDTFILYRVRFVRTPQVQAARAAE